MYIKILCISKFVLTIIELLSKVFIPHRGFLYELEIINIFKTKYMNFKISMIQSYLSYMYF